MNGISIKALCESGPELDQAETLFQEMYRFMSLHGLILPLAPDGAKRWRRSVEATLGRLGTLVVAQREHAVVGFAQGTVRLIPDYLIGGRVGAVGHVFVTPAFRSQGIGRAMCAALEVWFGGRAVTSLELQVLCANASAISLYEKLGFRQELVQMRKLVVQRAE